MSLDEKLSEIQVKIGQGETYVAQLGEERQRIAKEVRQAQKALNVLVLQEAGLLQQISKRDGIPEQKIGF